MDKKVPKFLLALRLPDGGVGGGGARVSGFRSRRQMRSEHFFKLRVEQTSGSFQWGMRFCSNNGNSERPRGLPQNFTRVRAQHPTRSSTT